MRSCPLYATTEVRWFFAGPIPAQVAVWFRRVGRAPAQGARTDHYLQLPDVDAVGVKWREGRLEVKRRVADLGAVAFAPEIAGAVARWHKWSFALSEADVLASIRPARDWIAVAKDRRLHAYAVADGGTVRNVPPEVAPRSGCELELGVVEAAGHRGWTVAFEAFGEAEAQPEILRRTVAHVRQQGTAPPLPPAQSASYPRWLALFLTQKD